MGQNEALDLSCKSLPGDNTLIFSMCTLDEEEVQIFSKAWVLNGCVHMCCLDALDAHFSAVSDLAPA